MKLTNEELDAILANAGLELAQPYAENGKYRKDEYLFTRCPSCGTEAHYRLKYILDKNDIGEKACRTCYWMHWYGDDRAVKNSAIKRMLDNGADIDNLIDQGAISAPDPLSISKAQKLAEDNGFDFVDLLQGSRDGDDVLVVRCKSCGRQTAERPEDVAFGCTCGGKSLGDLLREGGRLGSSGGNARCVRTLSGRHGSLACRFGIALPGMVGLGGKRRDSGRFDLPLPRGTRLEMPRLRLPLRCADLLDAHRSALPKLHRAPTQGVRYEVGVSRQDDGGRFPRPARRLAR